VRERYGRSLDHSHMTSPLGFAVRRQETACLIMQWPVRGLARRRESAPALDAGPRDNSKTSRFS
jgi:hypothetical protein